MRATCLYKSSRSAMMDANECGEKTELDTSEEVTGARSPPSADPRRGVSFNSTLKLVLIPSRGEFKRAGMYEALWWTSVDFLQFQAAANSEIRMLASYEGIGAKLARFKLYQPGSEGIDGDEFRGLIGEATCGTDSGSEVSSLPSTPSSSPYSSALDLPALAVKTAAKGAWRSSAAALPNSNWQPPVCSSPGGFSSASSAKTMSAIAAVAPSSSAATSPPPLQASGGSSTAPVSSGRNRGMSGGVVGACKADGAAERAGAREAGALWGSSIEDSDDTFGLFQEEESKEESPTTTPVAASEEAGEDGGQDQQQNQRPPSIDSDSGSTILTACSSGGSSDDGEGLDDIVFPSAETETSSPQGLVYKQRRGMRKVSSLDCVKSALRAPLPEGLDDEAGGASPWSWNGKLKSSLTGRKTATKAPLSPPHSSSSSASPRGLQEDGFWRLCVSIDKPNGLDGEPKSRFSNRTYGHGHEIMGGMGLLSLLGWVFAFLLVAYLVFDHGTAALPDLPDGGIPLAQAKF